MKELEWFEKIPDEKQKTEKMVQDDKQSGTPNKNLKMSQRVDLGKHIEDANNWIAEVAVSLGSEEQKGRAYKALRCVLHVIRDRMTHEELFQFAAQMPMLIRGLFFEGYHYTGKPDKFHVDELLDRIDEGMGPAGDMEPEAVFSAVLKVFYKHISEGELEDIYATMPKDIKELWDESL